MFKSILIITAILGTIYIINCFQIEDLFKPDLYIDEICSYNNNSPDTVTIKKDSSGAIQNVICKCTPEYANEPSMRKINKVNVQCGYERKRRFIALFLSFFLPFGLDYLYLGQYWIFIGILLACCFTIIGNCYRFAVSSHSNYFKNHSNLFFTALAILSLIWWVINIILIASGKITDGNGIETVSDLNLLVYIR
jgi:hypothetical protein